MSDLASRRPVMPAANKQSRPAGHQKASKPQDPPRRQPTRPTYLASLAAPYQLCAPSGTAAPRALPTMPLSRRLNPHSAANSAQAVQSNPVYKRSQPDHPRQLASRHATSYKPLDSGLAQERALLEAGRIDGASTFNGASDPVPERPDQADRERTAESRASLREGSSKSVVVDGLQGPHAADQRGGLPSADHDR
jgi:hypothetical protein